MKSVLSMDWPFELQTLKGNVYVYVGEYFVISVCPFIIVMLQSELYLKI